jgi:hypothetical protein
MPCHAVVLELGIKLSTSFPSECVGTRGSARVCEPETERSQPLMGIHREAIDRAVLCTMMKKAFILRWDASEPNKFGLSLGITAPQRPCGRRNATEDVPLGCVVLPSLLLPSTNFGLASRLGRQQSSEILESPSPPNFSKFLHQGLRTVDRKHV